MTVESSAFDDGLVGFWHQTDMPGQADDVCS
jgi:hypothetical protein